MTIIVLDDDGKEVIRMDPTRMPREAVRAFCLAMLVEKRELDFVISTLERWVPGAQFVNPVPAPSALPDMEQGQNVN